MNNLFLPFFILFIYFLSNEFSFATKNYKENPVAAMDVSKFVSGTVAPCSLQITWPSKFSGFFVVFCLLKNFAGRISVNRDQIQSCFGM